MALIVNTDTYVTVAELEAYALKRNITIVATDKEVILTKALDYLEVQRYNGYKTVSTQALQFPRVLCQSIYSSYPQSYIPCDYDSNEVPNDIKTAQIVAALLIDSGEDLQPTLGKTSIKEKIDVIEVEYREDSRDSKVFSQLNALLAPFLLSGNGLKLIRV